MEIIEIRYNPHMENLPHSPIVEFGYEDFEVGIGGVLKIEPDLNIPNVFWVNFEDEMLRISDPYMVRYKKDVTPDYKMGMFYDGEDDDNAMYGALVEVLDRGNSRYKSEHGVLFRHFEEMSFHNLQVLQVAKLQNKLTPYNPLTI